MNNFKVLNDSVNRGIKLAHCFLYGARLEEQYQNILQVVENTRKILPNQRNWQMKLAGTLFLTI